MVELLISTAAIIYVRPLFIMYDEIFDSFSFKCIITYMLHFSEHVLIVFEQRNNTIKLVVSMLRKCFGLHRFSLNCNGPQFSISQSPNLPRIFSRPNFNKSQEYLSKHLAEYPATLEIDHWNSLHTLLLLHSLFLTILFTFQ